MLFHIYSLKKGDPAFRRDLVASLMRPLFRYQLISRSVRRIDLSFGYSYFDHGTAVDEPHSQTSLNSHTPCSHFFLVISAIIKAEFGPFVVSLIS